MRSPHLSRHARRAFTLIELLVAMTAGIFVAVAAFALARQGSHFFQSETRIAAAQFSVTLGFDRLRADVTRAGFLSTPNIQRDPLRCPPGAIDSGWPAGVRGLGAVRLTAATPSEAQDATNGLAPDSIDLTGSFASSETFPVRGVFANGAAFDVYLQTASGPYQRTATNADLANQDGGAFGALFRAGRILQLVDAGGHREYGVISGYSVNGSGQPIVSLEASPAIPFATSATACGVVGFMDGGQASVISRIRYELRDLNNPGPVPTAYAPLYDAGPVDEGARFDLVRVEVDSTLAEMSDTLEVVSEWAVDLRFAFTVAAPQGTDCAASPPATGPGSNPSLCAFPFGHASNYLYGGDVSANTGPGPERLRAVRMRLVVRSREADRQANIPVDGGIFRYALPGEAGAPSFSRTRTLAADAQFANLAGISW